MRGGEAKAATGEGKQGPMGVVSRPIIKHKIK